MPDPFTPDVIEAVARHMNEDHAEDSVLICRALGGAPDVTAATLVHLDGQGLDFDCTAPEGARRVRVPFTAPITERAAIRAEVAAMYHRACEALGVAPRPAEPHEGAPPG